MKDDRNEENKIKHRGSAKPRNTNLRLVKNGDRPVEKEENTKEPAEPAERAKKGAEKTAGGKPKKEKTAEKAKTGHTGKKKKKKKKKLSPGREYGRKTFEKNNIYADRPGIGDWFLQNRSLVITAAMLLAAVLALAAGIYYLLTHYRVTTVYVDGNVHYSSEEVMEMVMKGRYGDNSLYLAMKYRDKGMEGIPFVEKMDISVLAPDTIRINVYEKALAGYVEYLGRYMYFDKDGIIVESSDVTTAGIPQVTGLNFSYVVLGEPLPVEEEGIFKNILSITQLLNKYNLSADKIFFDSALDLTLYFEKIKVSLGPSDNLDEKIMKLQYILPKLEGKSGTLPMNNYTEDTKLIPFNPD